MPLVSCARLHAQRKKAHWDESSEAGLAKQASKMADYNSKLLAKASKICAKRKADGSTDVIYNSPEVGGGWRGVFRVMTSLVCTEA